MDMSEYVLGRFNREVHEGVKGSSFRGGLFQRNSLHGLKIYGGFYLKVRDGPIPVKKGEPRVMRIILSEGIEKHGRFARRLTDLTVPRKYQRIASRVYVNRSDEGTVINIEFVDMDNSDRRTQNESHLYHAVANCAFKPALAAALDAERSHPARK